MLLQALIQMTYMSLHLLHLQYRTGL